MRAPSVPAGAGLLLLAALAGGALWYMTRPGNAGALGQSLGLSLGTAAVDLVDGAASGVVYGIGDAVGIPRTDETACQKAMREGRTLDASFACPALTFGGHAADATVSWWRALDINPFN